MKNVKEKADLCPIYRVLKDQNWNSLQRLINPALLLLWMQELREKGLSMVTQTRRGVELRSEPKSRLIVDFSIQYVEREHITNLIVCEQISRDGLRIPQFP